MAKIISDELLKGIINYLKIRPLGEVIDGYIALTSLPDAPEVKLPIEEKSND